MATYKGILTNNGKALIAGATVSNKINYSHIAVGDGNGSVPVPSETRTALINEKARIALNVVEINPNNTNQIVCEAIIPSNVGGFYIRELGLYAGNTMVVNSSYPLTYKPLADEGGAREINIKLVINIQNAEVIALYLDDSLIYATREWVNKNYIRRNEIVDNLTTDDPTKPLSAKQGKYLQDNKLDKTANAVGLKMGDDRTLLPTELSPLSLQAYFGTLDSNNNSTFFCDYLTLNGWVDSSGGMKNALVFSKTGQSLHHYQADYSSDTWTIKKQIAYTDSNISGNAASATKLQNGRKINDVVFDGTKDIYLEAPVRFNGTISTLQQLDQALLDGKYTVVEFNVAGLYGYGVLVVFRSGGMCHQVYYPHQAAGTNNATMAMRQAWNVNGNIASWSDWRIVGTRDDSKLPLVGGTVSGNLRVNGIVFSNKVYGDSDLWFTSEDEQKARRILTGGILASDFYSEANLIPNLGIYAKGAIHTKTGVYADKYYGYNGIATYVGNLDGRLTTPRLINGVAFDASTDINIPPVSFYIPAGADLNNYKRTGFYYQNADVDAAKITNVPQGNAFALRVEESAGCSQWLTPYNGGGVVYYRHFYDGTWSTWIKMDPHNIDGNAATATKLKNPRKIFGQDFDGSSDVAGNITTSTGMVVSDSFHYIDMGRPGVDRMNLAVYGGIFNFINAENGNVIARLNSNGIDCNAATATKLQTPRNIAISGAVSGSANFDGSGNITIVTTSNNAIGVGQIWQDLIASRSSNTTYTNTTGKPIQVAVTTDFSISYFYIDGNQVSVTGDGNNNITATHVFIIPNGSTYSFSGRLKKWWELR
ncbi:phage tail-collar fiber domain-containing protein [Acinetobacter baumannii]|uniref:phage tail-collar fiber domain-containing protein n=1 Tax=Acinetobacter baumannii TaxID=470 RepID=UPI0004E199D0|nr:phage tail protein [Acinetobacter baumannii]MCZ3202691.1 phage tail protein [Acinetobacter baumannii]MDQ8999495.1 phage tail protein [Acinetobacter baumannii]MDQ9002964.1 phage tail protein [Acinetobacter baumannii]